MREFHVLGVTTATARLKGELLVPYSIEPSHMNVKPRGVLSRDREEFTITPYGTIFSRLFLVTRRTTLTAVCDGDTAISTETQLWAFRVDPVVVPGCTRFGTVFRVFGGYRTGQTVHKPSVSCSCGPKDGHLPSKQTHVGSSPTGSARSHPEGPLPRAERASLGRYVWVGLRR